jgi:uncharacterized protein (TIGR00297 family)
MNTLFHLPQMVIGAVLAFVVVMGSYFARALTVSGALTAFVLGTLFFGFGGLPWAALLLTFFVTSSFLSLIFKHRKNQEGVEFEKGSRRDGWQVLANGGIAGLMVMLGMIFPGSIFPWMAGAGALAAANADTWATELGILSRSDPVMITTGTQVPRGTSGGVSLAGMLAALSGSFVMGTVFWVFTPVLFANLGDHTRWWMAGMVILAGVAGSLVDSLLGATVQAIYYCPACQKETEKHPLHHCGTPTRQVRGLKWLNNDWVNFFCTFSGALIALAIGVIL